MAALRRLLLGLMLVCAGALATPSPSIGPHFPIDIVVDTLAPQAQAITSSQRAVLRRGVSPVASWSAATDPFPSTILTPSRTSNGMLFDSTGKLTYAPNNLLRQSNDLTAVNWSKLNAAVSNQAVASPVGSPTASYVQEDTTNGFHAVYQATSAADPTNRYGVVVYLKSATRNAYVILDSGTSAGTQVSVNLATGAFVTTGALAGSAAVSVSDAAGGWWKVTINNQAYTSGSSTRLLVYIINGAALSYAGDGASGLYVSGGALSAVTYETAPRYFDQVITGVSAYYGPRVDYTYPSNPGLLVEGSRTNIVLQNRDLTNAAWTKGATITVAKDQTGIDGVANSASSITGGAVSSTNTVLQSITLASSTRAQSAWVKRITGSGTVNMTTDGGTTWNAITLTSSWTLVQFSQAAVTNPNVGFQVTTLNDKIAVDFVQNETGTYATSSLQTAATSVTRAADSLAAAAYSSNPAIIQYRAQSTGTRARKKLTTFSSISSETAEWIEAIRVYPVGTSSAYLDAHLTVDGAW